MRRQHDEGLKFWFAPRENEKPFTEPERAQRWRLSLASLLFITVLLSDHLWFCTEAKLTRTRDKRSDEGLAITDMGEYTNSLHLHQTPVSPDPYSPIKEKDAIFIGNSTLWRMDSCLPDSLSKDCFTFADADAVCLGLSAGGETGTQPAHVNLSDLYLSFCNSYSLLDLFYGFTSVGNLNCTLDVAIHEDQGGCRKCVRVYQSLDRRAQENYREFELLVQKYETDVYSVRTCMEECKVGPTRRVMHTHTHTGTRARRFSLMGGYAVVMVTIGHFFQILRVSATSALCLVHLRLSGFSGKRYSCVSTMQSDNLQNCDRIFLICFALPSCLSSTLQLVSVACGSDAWHLEFVPQL